MENDMKKSPNCNWSGGFSREKETGGREGSQPTRGGQAETWECGSGGILKNIQGRTQKFVHRFNNCMG